MNRVQGKIALTGGLLVALSALTLLAPLSSDAMLPALPTIAAEFAVTADRVQLTLTAGLIGAALGQLLFGPLSDAVGRRAPLLVGTAAMIAASVACAVAPNLEVLIGGCALAGVAGSAGMVLSRAVAADIAAGSSLVRAYSLLGVLVGIGPVIGAFGGAVVLDLVGWRPVFWILAGVCVVTLVLAGWWVPETLPRARRSTLALGAFLTSARDVLRSRVFLLAALTTWFAFGAVFAYLAASPFLLQTLFGFSATEFAVVLAVDGVGLMITGALAARLATRVTPLRLLTVGISITMTGALIGVVAVVTGTVSAWTMIPSMVLIGVSMGFVFGPATALALRDFPERSGTALAVLGSVQFVFAGIAAPLVGVAGDRSAVPYVLVTIVCALAATMWLAQLARALAAPIPHRG